MKKTEIINSPTYSELDPNRKVVREIPSLRGENIKQFLMSDKTIQVAMYDEPVHFEKNGTWNDIGHIVIFYTILINRECLLENYSVLVPAFRVAAGAEVAQTVADIFPLIGGNPLKYPRMVRYHKIGALVNDGLCQCGMYIAGGIGIFISPVKGADDDLCAVFLELLYIFHGLGFTADAIVTLVDAGKADFNPLDLDDGGVIAAEAGNACVVQRRKGIHIALVAVIMGVVVGNIDAVDAALGENTDIGGISLEGPLFIRAVCGRGKRAFQIGNGQIVPLKDRPDVLKKITVSVFVVVFLKAAAVVRPLVGRKGDITDEAQGNGNSAVGQLRDFCRHFLLGGGCLLSEELLLSSLFGRQLGRKVGNGAACAAADAQRDDRQHNCQRNGAHADGALTL